MGYFAGLITPIEKCKLKTIKNQPFGSEILVYHSSLADPAYSIRQQFGDGESTLLSINHKGAKQLIKALEKLIAENEKAGYA